MVLCKVLTLVLLADTCMALPGRIIGGQPTTIENYPSIVQVDSLGVWSGVWAQDCAGTILTSVHVLSVASCFVGLYYPGHSYRRIRAGSTDRNSGGVIVYIAQVFKHPSFGSFAYDGDISVLRLTNQLSFGATIAPGTIIAQGFEIPDNSSVVLAGWGALSQGGAASSVLRDVTTYTVNRQLCSDRHGDYYVTENMICAGIMDIGGTGACLGDTGNPLYYENILVGVLSWSTACADKYYPEVSTRVSSYTNWIVDTAV